MFVLCNHFLLHTQVVDCREHGPVRCKGCQAYMSSNMVFIEGGSRFKCGICQATTATPAHYFCPLGPHGRRHDVFERPELCKGAVELLLADAPEARPRVHPWTGLRHSASTHAPAYCWLRQAAPVARAALDAPACGRLPTSAVVHRCDGTGRFGCTSMWRCVCSGRAAGGARAPLPRGRVISARRHRRVRLQRGRGGTAPARR